jgi:hypothetical protein
MPRPFTTRMRHPAEWCAPFQSIISDNSYTVAGTGITIDLDSMSRDPECGGRVWSVLDRQIKLRSCSMEQYVCEHNIEIGD